MGIAKRSTYSSTWVTAAVRRCHCGIGTGGGAGLAQRQPSRAHVSRKTVMPIHLWYWYQYNFCGLIGNGTIDNPSSRLVTISTAVSQCSVIAPLLYFASTSSIPWAATLMT